MKSRSSVRKLGLTHKLCSAAQSSVCGCSDFLSAADAAAEGAAPRGVVGGGAEEDAFASSISAPRHSIAARTFGVGVLIIFSAVTSPRLMWLMASLARCHSDSAACAASSSADEVEGAEEDGAAATAAGAAAAAAAAEEEGAAVTGAAVAVGAEAEEATTEVVTAEAEAAGATASVDAAMGARAAK